MDNYFQQHSDDYDACDIDMIKQPQHETECRNGFTENYGNDHGNNHGNGSVMRIEETMDLNMTSYMHTGSTNYVYPSNEVNDIREHFNVSNDPFLPTALPPMLSSLPERSSSAESASTSSTTNTVVSIGNQYHMQDQQSRLPTPQRRNSASASVGMVSVDEQTVQPTNYFSLLTLTPRTATRLLSTSSSDSGPSFAASNIKDMGLDPTPIDPHLYHSNSQRQNSYVRQQQTLSELETDPKMVDELIANELNKLSFQERESINEEIHGIEVRNAGVKETPELLQNSFDELEKELQNLRPKFPAFDRSQLLFGATTYLNTEDLRLMFLRCDLFDCKKAARRLCDYTELVLEIYGDFALERRAYLSDLTNFELAVLETGGYQVLPGRDRAGRRILGNLAFDPPSRDFGIRPRMRLSVYCIMSVLEDIETQRKGIVAISWWHNVNVDDFIIRGKVHKRIHCVPMRVGAFHCCIPSEAKSVRIGKKNTVASKGVMSYVIKGMTGFSVGSDLRPHLRFHTGSVVECIYALQSFGIHSDQIPVNSSSGKLKTKQHSKWMQLCRLKEESLKNDGRKFDRIVECPQQTDVLFGRGRPIMRHPGNAVLRSVVQSKLEEYASAKSKKETTDVTWEVVRTLKGQYGARFLKEENIENDGLGWIEVSNETARQKVRIAFRDLRTKITKKNAAEIDANSTNDTMKTNETSKSGAKAKRKNQPASPVTTPSDVTSTMMPLFQRDSCQQIQEADSSTAVFLGLDGSNLKRQRHCFG
mmetsp:Transcript_77253/g.156819  ORF Transcript_77253/g.156819 Transcript_77253/m.156819 type:complete len:760 (-) Transcript_77253:1179-3458(-)|eukprot:CAMPEP_0201222526 /NCGR_PEP_ID=MMETSP0851-20130426/192649_1 /ASSEMBLY_ACC=CAM_ASM_000631 /TAXON_ID=183588 /ORGANISM="Pseudo-nitzschia fraudulenta, Strain WWA7" /LENGTH=759 /DNA_ID=CAMNT_0047512277 /DNA_START=302 /DNA_END=2581 /DNA_ORIENTATION=+